MYFMPNKTQGRSPIITVNGSDKILISRNGDIFQCIGPFLGFADAAGKPVGGILHHRQLDGQLLYLFKIHPGLIQSLRRTVKGIGQIGPVGLGLNQGNLSTHNTAGFDADRLF